MAMFIWHIHTVGKIPPPTQIKSTYPCQKFDLLVGEEFVQWNLIHGEGGVLSIPRSDRHYRGLRGEWSRLLTVCIPYTHNHFYFENACDMLQILFLHELGSTYIVSIHVYVILYVSNLIIFGIECMYDVCMYVCMHASVWILFTCQIRLRSWTIRYFSCWKITCSLHTPTVHTHMLVVRRKSFYVCK